MNEIKVSVIIPVYNTENYLKKCLDSVLAQTLKEIEIICVDDGSTDKSLDIVKRYQEIDNRFIILKQNNQFAGAARNNGLKIARGEYIAFLDADDFYVTNALEQLYEKAKRYKLDFIKGRFYYLNDKNNDIYESDYSKKNCVKSELTNRIIQFIEAPEQFIYIADVPWNGLYKRSFLRDNDIKFNNLRCVNDHSFFIECLLAKSKFMVTDVYVNYYRVGQNDSLIVKKAKYFNCQIESYNIVKKLLQKYNVSEKYKQIILSRELNAIFGWYEKLKEDQKYYNEREKLIYSFLKDYNESDVGYTFLQNFVYKEAYYKLKNQLYRNYIQDKNIMVSIIVPVYNTQAYIEECLNSLICQTYKNIEIICVDDASKDNSANVLKEFSKKDNRIKLVFHSINKHQGGARNSGINIARGKYVWFVDSDDFIDNNAVEILVNKMEELNDVDVLCFNATAFSNDNKEIVIEEGSIVRNWPINKKISIPKDASLLPDNIEGSSVTYFSKADFIDKFRFRENVVFEDADFSFRVFTSNANFYIINYAPYHRRISDTSTTGHNAAGKNLSCIIGRILAAQEIFYTIKQNNIPENMYSVKWFKRWAKWSIELYIQEDTIHEKSLNDIVRLLQEEYRLFKEEEVINNYKLFLPSIIVSLTSYPKRIEVVDKVIKSILNQTISPDKILLYLSNEEFKNVNLPNSLSKLECVYSKFQIKYCDNLKAHKKYFYCMQEYRGSIIITVDDDVEYDKNLILNLIKSYIRYPKAISCMRGHTIKMYDEYTFAPYVKWLEEKRLVNQTSLLTIATGVSGVLYPPQILPLITFEKDLIKNFLTVDDLWLKRMELERNISTVLIEANSAINNIEGTQNDALWLQNVRRNVNDKKWRDILEIFGWDDEIAEEIKFNLYKEYKLKILKKDVEKYEIKKLPNLHLPNRLGLLKKVWRCYKEHGLSYTLKRIKIKLKSKIQ